MPKWIALLAVLTAAPYWESTEVKDWNEEQLIDFFNNSPWAQPAEAVASTGSKDGLSTFLATSVPMQLAELEMRRRRIRKVAGVDVVADPAWEEFREFLERDRGKYIVLAVAIPANATLEATGMAMMENQSIMKIGKQKVKMSGYFPPSPTDGYTRMIFPRGNAADAKEIVFELYVPGTGMPNRMAIYSRKAMNYRGRLEM